MCNSQTETGGEGLLGLRGKLGLPGQSHNLPRSKIAKQLWTLWARQSIFPPETVCVNFREEGKFGVLVSFYIRRRLQLLNVTQHSKQLRSQGLSSNVHKSSQSLSLI